MNNCTLTVYRRLSRKALSLFKEMYMQGLI